MVVEKDNDNSDEEEGGQNEKVDFTVIKCIPNNDTNEV